MSRRESARGRPACRRGRTRRSRARSGSPVDDRGRCRPAGTRHRVAERDAFSSAHARTPRRRCWRARMRRASAADAAGLLGEARPARQGRPRRACECRSSRPCASLVILATPPAMVTRGTGWRAQIFQHAADEIAHVDQRRSRAGRGASAPRLPRSTPVAPATWVEAGGARHVDAAMDRVDPGRAGIGHDDAGGAEDRQSADDAEPPVERLCGKRLAARDGDLDLDIARVPMRRADLGDARRASSVRGTGLIAGSPGGTGRPGRVTVPTPSPARKVTPLPGAPRPHRGEDQRAMGHVGIVAGVLDHAGRRRAVASAVVASAKAGRLPPRQASTSTGSGNSPGQQRRKGGLGGRRGAGAGGPAAAEHLGFRCHAHRYKAPNGPRHGGTLLP